MDRISIEKQIKELLAKLKMIEKRIEAIPQEVDDTQKKIGQRKSDLEGVIASIEEGRRERQKLLVSGGKVEQVSQRIKGGWERCDLIEDEILGLKEKVKDLDAESSRLVKEKSECENEIIKTRLIPLFEDYNETGGQLAKIMEGILSLMGEYNLEYGPEGWGRFFSPSSWIGFRIIPRLYWANDKPQTDFFNITEITLKRQREQREEAYKLSNTPDPEA